MLEERVAAGVALLDEYDPKWRESINSYSLDMASPTQCVLGQRNGMFSFGCYELGLDPNDAYKYGFETDGTDTYSELTQEWFEVINN